MIYVIYREVRWSSLLDNQVERGDIDQLRYRFSDTLRSLSSYTVISDNG